MKIAVLLVITMVIGCAQQKAKDKQSSKPARVTSPATRPIPRAGTTQTIMRAKLAASQKIIEAVVMQDFKRVRQHAMQLNTLSQSTDFQIHRTLEYVRFSTEFNNVTKDMADHAKQENIHLVALDQMQMTMTCVKCHSYMHSEGLVELDKLDLTIPTALLNQPNQ